MTTNQKISQLPSGGILQATDNIPIERNVAGTLTNYSATIPANITTQGNAFNAATQLVQLDSTGKYPALDGSQITNINAVTTTNIAGGAANELVYQSGVSVTSFINTVDNAVLVTNSSGQPLMSTTLPAVNAAALTNLIGALVSTSNNITVSINGGSASTAATIINSIAATLSGITLTLIVNGVSSNSVSVQPLISTPTANDLVTVSGTGQVQDSGVSITTSPTANVNTQVMTSQAVQSAITGATTSSKSFRGGYNASSNTYPSTGGSGTSGAIIAGDNWIITTAGTLGGEPVTINDTITALVSTPGQTAANWSLNTANVESVFGRQGVIMAQSGDYTITQITNGLSNVLPNGEVFVGNSSNIANPTTITNNVTSSANNLTSTVLGVASNTVNIINSNTVSSSANSLSTAVNGVASSASAPIINSNNLTSAINAMTSTVNGIASSSANIINSHSLNSSGNSLTSTTNGVTTTAVNIVNSVSNGYNGNQLTTTVNGVADAGIEIDGGSILSADPTNGITTNTVGLNTSLLNIHNSISSSGGLAAYNSSVTYNVGYFIRGDGTNGNLDTIYICNTNGTTGTFNLSAWVSSTNQVLATPSGTSGGLSLRQITAGDLAFNYTNIENNVNYTIVSNVATVVQTATLTNSFLWTLPAASSITAGTKITVQDISRSDTSANYIRITTNGTDTISGIPSGGINFLPKLLSNRNTMAFVSNGSNSWSLVTISGVTLLDKIYYTSLSGTSLAIPMWGAPTGLFNAYRIRIYGVNINDTATNIIENNGVLKLQFLNAGYNSSTVVTTGYQGISLSANPAAAATGLAVQQNSLGSGNGLYVNNTFYIMCVNNNGYILTGTDGVHFNTQVAVSGINWVSSAYGYGYFILVGAGPSAARSTDGVHWQSITIGFSGTPIIEDIAYGISTFVVVTTAASMAYSTNAGTSWTVFTPAAASGANFNAIIFLNNLFIAVGSSGTILTSTNATIWNAYSAGTTQTLYAITYGNGLYVVGGAANGSNMTICTASSPSGPWTLQSVGGTSTISGLTYSSTLGLFVAVTSAGLAYTSSNGTTWTSSSPFSGYVMSSVTWDGVQFLAGTSSSPITWTSIDGVNWTINSASVNLGGLGLNNIKCYNNWYGATAQDNIIDITVKGGFVSSGSQSIVANIRNINSSAVIETNGRLATASNNIYGIMLSGVSLSNYGSPCYSVIEGIS